MEIVKLKPAPLHNAVFMPLIPTMAVVIAALLHKLSAKIVLKMYFPPARMSLHLIFSVLLLLLISLPFRSHFPFISLFPSILLTFSFISLFLIYLYRGQEMNSCLPLIRWCMKLLGAMKSRAAQRVGNGEESGMFWQAALKERWGALQMLACNNGSRSHFHRFLEPGTLPLGNHFHASPPSMFW